MDYTQHSHKEAPLSLSNQYGYTFLRLYQTGFGKFIKSHCPMQPSCSHYSIEAVSQYGLIRGVILTADRLLHEIDEAALVEKIWIKGRGYCCLDPVSRNVMWTENSNPIASSFSLQLKETK
ncbi:MAG: membrane protein insertion efficiency factor YidD [Kiritimatiellae bacterium]|nr:membrane protein insertion efficiency factor YidD [Kiritimatiellia bacterium]